jgi:hypothetical protein
MIAQISHQYKTADRVYTVKAETQTTHAWVNGEPVFTETPVVILESANADGYDRQLQAVMPLAQAIEIAKAVLAQAAQAQRDESDEMYWIHDLNYGAGHYRAEL